MSYILNNIADKEVLREHRYNFPGMEDVCIVYILNSLILYK